MHIKKPFADSIFGWYQLTGNIKNRNKRAAAGDDGKLAVWAPFFVKAGKRQTRPLSVAPKRN